MMICYRRVRMRKPATLEEPSRSAQVVASSADLLTELLLRLPVKSQLKFKCVCRRWLLLITDPHFIRRKCLISNTVSGLYLDCYSLSERCICYEFVPLDASQKRATFQYLTFAGYPHGIRILQSCNGLLLCRSVGGDLEYFVYNPATKQFKALPLIPRRAGKRVFGFSLAFDPSISLSYKVICITGRKFSRAGCRLLIYSSETVGWRVSGAPFTAPLDVEFDEARVYWNGAIHWFSMTDTSLYFDLGEELVLQMPMPPPPLEYSDEKRHRYFGESFGHLHLVDSYSERLTTELIVYEMERDRSGWFVKFRLDQDVFASSTSPFYPIKVLCVAREEKEEDSFMVVHISDATNSNDVKVIRHNFISQTQKVICDSDFLGLHPWLPVVQYIENLSLV